MRRNLQNFTILSDQKIRFLGEISIDNGAVLDENGRRGHGGVFFVAKDVWRNLWIVFGDGSHFV